MEQIQKKKGLIKYKTLYGDIAEQIDSCEMSVGDKLLTESQLCKKYEVSRQTVRMALGALENSGYITRIKGKGSFIKKDTSVKRVKTIGVCLSFLDSYIFPEVLQGIEAVLAREGYGIDLRNGHNKVGNEREFLLRALEMNLAGIIVEGIKSALPNPNEDIYRELKNKKVPIVFVHNHYQNVKCHAVELDDAGLMFEATEILIKARHRKIGGIFKFDDRQGQQRYLGFAKALLRNGLEVDESKMFWYDSVSLTSCDARNSKIFDDFASMAADCCTAVACYSDYIAVQVINRLKALGKRIPQDISVIGFDHSEVTKSVGMMLVSANHPKDEMGKSAAERLISLIKNPQALKDEAVIYHYPTTVIMEESVAAPCDESVGHIV